MYIYRVCCTYSSECCKEGEAQESTGHSVGGEHGWVCLKGRGGTEEAS